MEIIELIASFLAVIVVLTLHEFAHSFVAYKCGDPTPKWSGRLSLNPMRHFDPIGLVCFALVGLGWAKPVPINPNNFKKFRLGLFLTASAGIIVNYISAFVFYPIAFLILFSKLSLYINEIIVTFFYLVFYCIFAYSLSFCVFNLLPLYPLDGFRIVDALNRKRGKVYRFLRENGYMILLGLIVESFICDVFVNYLHVDIMSYFDILGWIMSFATNIFGWPITAFWELFLW